MTLITIPELNTTTVLPLNSLFPLENVQLGQTQNTTLGTILSYVEPKTKLYINNVLSGTYPAINLIAGNNISLSTSNNPNYFNVTLSSNIPNPLSITNVGAGLGLYKNFTSTYNFKTLQAGANITLTPTADSILISTNSTGESNTVSNVGVGVPIFKQQVGTDLQFKTIIAGSNISIDTSNPNQITINSIGGAGNSTGQNIGVGNGKIYINNIASTLRFKTLKAGTNISITDSPSEIIISSLGAAGTNISSTDSPGSKLLSAAGQIKTLLAGDGVLINETDTTLTLATNTTNNLGNVGSGTGIYKGFNSVIDKHELKTIIGQDGILVESLNVNEIVIKGNSSSSVASTNATNTLISSQVGNTTTLKVINAADSNTATITNNPNNLTLNILNNNKVWNANRINNIPIVFPASPTSPEQESTLVYRGTDYVTGSPNNVALKYLTQQSYGSHIPSNNEIFKISGSNTWSLASPSISTSPLINFLGYYLSGKLYLSGSIIDDLIGLTAGTIYYLDNTFTISITPSAVILGVAINSTTLWFKPYAT